MIRHNIYIMNLSAYRDVLGKPNEGVHSVRLFNVAIIDVIMTIIAGIVIGLLCHFKFVGIVTIILILFILGTILHLIFGVDTTITKFIKKNEKNKLN